MNKLIRSEITNDSVFSWVMEQGDNCLKLIQAILPELNIEKIEFQTQKRLDFGKDSKRAIPDILAFDKEGRVYDLEMQLTRSVNLGKRMRYYQSMVDQEVLMKGEPYDHLKESYIIVILPQDPFDEQRKRYTFKTHCLESDRVDLKENTTMILLNSRGIKGEVSERLQRFFDLMNGKMDIEDSYIKQLQESIAKYMSDPGRKRKFMADINDELDWKAEGRAIGLLEGQEKAIMRTILTLREDFGANNDEILRSLVKRFGQDYSQEQLQKMINEAK